MGGADYDLQVALVELMDTVAVDVVGWKMQRVVAELVHTVDVNKALNYWWLH